MTDDLLPALALGLLCSVVWFAARRGRGAQSWAEPHPVDLPKPRLTMTHGGVVQRAKPAVPPLPFKAFVLPATFVKTELDAEDGTVARILSRRLEGWVAKGNDDGAIADCVLGLWTQRREEVA